MRLSIFRRHIKNPQAGVTLLLSILILSSMLAISFSLATVLFVELRNSGDLIRTEPTLYGASAVAEEALFNVKRGTGMTAYSGAIGQIDVTSTETPLNDPVQQDRIAVTSNTFIGTQNRYALYNPADPYGQGGYGGIRVTFLNTAASGPNPQVHVYLCQFDALDAGATCTDPTNTSYMIYRDSPTTPLGPGQCWPSCSTSYSINPTRQQELIIYGTGNTSDLRVNIEAFDAGGNPKGLPYFGQTAVDISATNAGVTRNVRAVIPNTAN